MVKNIFFHLKSLDQEVLEMFI